MYMYTYVSLCVQFPFPPLLLFPPLNLPYNCNPLFCAESGRLLMDSNKAWQIKL